MVSTCYPFKKLGFKGEKDWGLLWDALESSKICFCFDKMEERKNDDGIQGNKGIIHKEVENMVYRTETD